MAQRILQVEADGGSRGNPGVAGYGALVRDPRSGEVLMTDAAPLGKASNNVAEYSGLIAGLRMARMIDPAARVQVLMDSKLVVEQMSGRWKIKHEDMRRLAAEAREILPSTQVTYQWIPRARNKDADQLSNEAMDAGARGGGWDAGASRIAVTAPAAPRAGEPGPADAEHEEAPRPAAGPGVAAEDERAVSSPEAVRAGGGGARPTGALHHVEIWVADLDAAVATLGWLFERLGYVPHGAWDAGRTYQGAGHYLVLESGPDVADGGHDRARPGLNHLAFSAGSPADVDALTAAAQEHGFTLMFADRHPHAGGPDHYAAYLETADGFEVELVAAGG